MRLLLCLLVMSWVATGSGKADVTLAGLFTDHAVLQRDKPLPVWGWAEPGEEVAVELAGVKANTKAGADGRWEVVFAPFPAGGPYTLNVTGKNTLQVQDVLIGEVWIGVGQSNMMMGIALATGGNEALAEGSKYPMLRMVNSGAVLSDEPAKDIQKVVWMMPNGGNSAAGYFFARQLYDYFKGKVPVGIMTFTALLPAQAWCDRELIKADHKVEWLYSQVTYPHNTGRLFNGTVVPIAPFSIRGILYYQGEMNAGGGMPMAKVFGELMPTLIKGWRSAAKDDALPFIFVQLPGFGEPGPANPLDMDPTVIAAINESRRQHGYVGIRESQLKTLQTVPHSGMAVTIDIGEPKDIHPHNKKAVGERLFLQARHVAYGDDSVVFSGPLPKKIEFKDAQVIVTFDYIGSKLVAHGDKLSGFEIAGSDQKLYPGDARIDGSKVIVTNQHVTKPSALYYAWAGFPDANLFNAEGLPASPFRGYNEDCSPLIQNRTEFVFNDPDFKEPVLNDPNLAKPEAWNFLKGAVLQKAADGTSVVFLPGTDATVVQSLKPIGAIDFNSDPILTPYMVRSGDAIGYSIEMAAGEGTGTASPLLRLYAPVSFDRMPKSDSQEFKRFDVAMSIPSSAKGSGDAPTLSLINLPTGRPLFIRKLSPLAIVHSKLGLNDQGPIDLGAVAAGKTADSKPLVISNDQKETLPEKLAATGDPQQVPTILYGLADEKPDGGDFQFYLSGLVDNVGAILIGKDAANFEFAGEHLTGDKWGVKFIGSDGQPGLSGGPSPEKELFTIHFLGSAKPGKFTAVLRIVTQAGNLGRLSQGNAGEPPLNLYYVDVPVNAEVN